MLKLASLIWIVLGATVAGSLVVVIVSVPSLYDNGMKLIPIVAIAGFVIAIPLAVWIARQIMGAASPRIGPQGS
jgi:hypothetical protein